MAAKRKNEKSSATIGFETKLWLAADKLRNNMDAAEYKHVVLGLIFLKYISDSFEELWAKLVTGDSEYQRTMALGDWLGDRVRYGRECNITAHLSIQNLAIRDIEVDIGKENSVTFRKVQHPDLNSEWNYHGLS